MSILSLFSVFARDNVHNYQNESPLVNPQEYFNGKIKATGLIQDFTGRVRRRFDIAMTGSWQRNHGILQEDFLYDDGETFAREWTLQKLDNGSYIGQASDIIGDATCEIAGNAMRWSYKSAIMVAGKRHILTFDDWMFLCHDGVMINRSYLKKWGLQVAQISLVMQKL